MIKRLAFALTAAVALSPPAIAQERLEAILGRNS